jgi:hypothetical protein
MFTLAAELSDNRIHVVYTAAPQAAACILQRCRKAGVFQFQTAEMRLRITF